MLKKSYLLLGAAAVLLVLVLCIPLFFRGNAEQPSLLPSSNMPFNSTANQQSSQETSEISASSSPKDISTEERYFVQTYKGNIGIFREGETEPMEILDVNVSTLPKVDQSFLEKGIYADSYEALRQIIEDYES